MGGLYGDVSNASAKAVAGKDIILAIFNEDGSKLYAVSGQQGLTINRLADSIEVTSFKLSSTTDTTAKLTWKKLTNADGYVVYKYNNSKKTWERVYKTDSNINSYTVKNLNHSTSSEGLIVITTT